MSAPFEIDYYEVLELQETAGSDEIKHAFRRLSLVRHPDKDRDNPRAHAAFCTLREAYETLSDTSKRILYNVQYVNIKARGRSFQEQQKRDRARQAQENARQSEAEVLRKLNLENSAGNIKRFAEEQREKEKLAQIQEDLAKIRSQLRVVEEESKTRLRVANSGIGLWGFLASWSKSNEQLEKEKTEREQENLQKVASERIKITSLERQIEELGSGEKAQLSAMQESRKRDDQRLEKFRQAHQAIKARAEAAAKKAAEQKRAQEEVEQEKATREMFARMKREQDERQKAAERAREERQKATEEAEKARRKLAAEKAAREKEARDREALLARIRAQEDARKATQDAEAIRRMGSVMEEFNVNSKGFKNARPTGRDPQLGKAHAAPKRKSKAQRTTQDESSCLHLGFWPKVEGKHRCAVCSQDFYRFVLQCPYCQMMACASCKKQLRSGGGRGRTFVEEVIDVGDPHYWDD